MPRRELLPGESPEYEWRLKLINDFWSDLYDGEDSGAATWEALDCLKDRVTMALRSPTPNICLAESITAQAAWMIAGQRES